MRVVKLLVMVAVVFSLSTASVKAISVTGPAVPLDAVDYPGIVLPGTTEAVTPPVDTWTTISADMDGAQESDSAGYALPQFTICDAAPVTQLSVTIPNTAVTLNAVVTDQQQVGVSARLVFRESPFTPRNISSVTDGTRMDGPFALAIDPNMGNVNIVRGFTNPGWTTAATTVPGAIVFEADTSGLTVGDYNNLAVTVGHDMYDGVRATHVDSISSEQPVITATADETACVPDEPAAPQNPAANSGTLANTGSSQIAPLAIIVTLIASGMIFGIRLRLGKSL